NSQFRVQSYEYEMIYRYFKQPEFESETEFMTTSQIANWLSAYTRANLSLKRIGQALKLQGYERKSGRENGISVYGYLVKKTLTEEEHQRWLNDQKAKEKDIKTPDDPDKW